MLMVASLLLAGVAGAQVAKQGNDVLSSLAFTSEKLVASEPIESFEDVESVLPPGLRNGWAAFRLGANAEWRSSVDKRTGQIAMAEGGGVAWVPGRGNALTNDDIAPFLGGRKKPDLAVVDAIARNYLPRVAALLGVNPSTLALNHGRSGQPADHVWFVDYDVVRDGLAIEGARVVFRANNGNLVQFGTEGLPSQGAVVPQTRLTRDAALAAVSQLVALGAGDTLLDAGSLHLLPAAVSARGHADGFEFGKGRGLAKVWQFTFRRDGVMGTWRARVDAATGELLEVQDINDYAQATGGVYMSSPSLAAEVVRPMPFADVATSIFANSAGIFGSATSSALNGQFVRVVDTCGAISKTPDGSGNLPFGTSTGTDCVTPGSGGAGNTHATRSQFYHVNRIKEVGRGWLPTNTWLQGKLTVNVNLNQTCNAYWNGSTLNFFKSGGGCGNTGEIAAISLHEYGHGLDSNDGNGSGADRGTGETYGDFTAALQLHASCIGPGFLTSNCGGYGDSCTACTGVRDINWSQHSSNTPHTVANFTQPRCPASSTYRGPCGKEGHCESYISSEALWDFANRDLPSPGTSAAWTVVDRLWYLSRSTATAAFACTAGTTYTSNGCNTGSLWKTMRAVDDDDGNLTNGTPHSGALFAAFNRHGIACTTDAGASTSFAGCAPPAAPAVTLTPGNNSVTVGVSGTGVKDIYRNELGCNNGFIKIANDFSGTSFTDTGVANGTTYFYQAVAHPSGNEACGSVPATCQSAVPTSGGGGCTPPGVATGVTATATGQTTATVSWTAVAGATEYHILRSTTSGGPYTQVGTSTGTSFADSGLTCNTTYFYVVRAANSATCEAGNSAQASALTSACTGCTTTTLYSKSFDADTGLAGWSTGTFGGTAIASWRGVQTCTAASGTRIFRYGGLACTDNYTSNNFNFAQPNGAGGIAIPAGSTTSRLVFKHRRAFETGFDGGTLTVSVDGTNYEFVPASAILSGSYNGTIAPDCAPAGSAGAAVYTGFSSAFTTTTVNLDAACNAVTGTTTGCAGRNVRIGFTTITDCSLTDDGWFIDDVSVTACTP